MSAKPTAGPTYLCSWIRQYFEDGVTEDDSVDVTIGGLAEMIGRLRVDGMAAMKILESIRAVEREFSESRMNAYRAMTAIAVILDEAKP